MIWPAAIAMLFGRVSPYWRSDMNRRGITATAGETQNLSMLHEVIVSAGDERCVKSKC